MALRYYISSEEAPFFINNKMGYSDRIPTSGSYKVGDFIISSTQANGIFGWVCTVAGTPGTWIEIGSGNSGGNIKTVSLRSTKTISTPVNEVEIGIDSFNKNTDTLMAYVNSTFMIEGVDYEIDNISSKIVSKNGNWNEESIIDYTFAFIVLKSIEVDEDGSVGGIDPVTLEKINTIGDVNQLQTENKTDLVKAINEVKTNAIYNTDLINQAIAKADEAFQSGNNVKNGLVEALIAKGIDASTSNSFSELIDKVDNIKTANLPKWCDGDFWINTTTLMPSSRYGLVASAIGNKIYVMGGYSGSSHVSKNECYDTTNNTWEDKTIIPTLRYRSVAGVVNNKIYLIGGSTGTTNYLKINECYDPSTDTWETKANMPTSRCYSASAVVDNNIYVIGGTGGNNKNECYNPSTDTWSTKTNILTSRNQMAASAVDNKIYVMGGFSGKGKNECYDPSTDTWSTKANLLTSRYQLTSSAVDNKIYLIGGYDTTTLTKNECYDPSTDTWTTKANMISSRHELATAVVDNKIYAIGGFTGSNSLKKHECYIP